MNDKEKIEVDGFKFTVEVETDDDSLPPWQEGDGHGPVRKSHHPHWHGEGVSDKRCGERPMNKPSRSEYQFYYDWQAACKRARKDGWNAEPYDAPNRVQRAVQDDFKYLCGYLNQDWYYVVITVTLDMYPAYTATLGGIETFKDYDEEMKQEMAQELIREYFEDLENMTIKGVELCSEA